MRTYMKKFFRVRSVPRRSTQRRRPPRGRIESLETRQLFAGDLMAPINPGFFSPSAPVQANPSQVSVFVPDDSPLNDLSAGIYLDGTTATLHIRGTTTDDVVKVRAEGMSTVAEINGQSQSFL